MAETAQLIVALGLRDGLSSGLGRVSGQLNQMQGSLGRVGRGIGQVGTGIDRILTRGAIAAGAALTGVITTAASFEQAFTGVEKTVDGTDAQLAELEGTLRQMARTMPVTFEELAAIGEAGGALGVARDSLDEFIDVVARLAVSTDLNAEAAATALGQLGTVLHLEGAEFEEFADSLVALGNAGASTESQIVELAARFAAAGNSAGLSKEEILALASATASMGIEVEAGGTALSQTFNNIATGIGTGSDEIKAFTDLMGISAADFKKRWTEDALGTFQDFLGELAKLDQFEQAAVLEDAGITGVRQLNAIKLMTQNLGFFGEQLAVSRDAAGELDAESQKFFDTTAGQWIILKNNIRDTAATIGAELLPQVNTLVKDFVGFLQLPGTQEGIKQFAKDLAAGIRGLVAELRGTDFSGLIEGMKTAATIARGAFDLFNKLPPDIKALAIGALVVNKATGGAVGSIAKGLTNILAGSIGGIVGLARGSSPANAVWVQSVGGLGGAPIVAGGAGQLVRLTLGAAGTVALGAELGRLAGKHFFFDPTVTPAVEFEQEQFNALVNRNKPDELRHAITELDKNIKGFEFGRDIPGIGAGIGFVEDFLIGDQLAILKDQKTLLEAQLAELVKGNQSKVGDTVVKRVTGGQKGASRLPDTAVDPGGGVVNLPDTAMSSLRTTSIETAKLPSILTRQERSLQVSAQRLASIPPALAQGFSQLGATVRTSKANLRVTVNVNSSLAISDTLRRITSARVATGTISEF